MSYDETVEIPIPVAPIIPMERRRRIGSLLVSMFLTATAAAFGVALVLTAIELAVLIQQLHQTPLCRETP